MTQQSRFRNQNEVFPRRYQVGGEKLQAQGKSQQIKKLKIIYFLTCLKKNWNVIQRSLEPIGVPWFGEAYSATRFALSQIVEMLELKKVDFGQK